jgi:hypothetical protein
VITQRRQYDTFMCRTNSSEKREEKNTADRTSFVSTVPLHHVTAALILAPFYNESDGQLKHPQTENPLMG